jgi:hypothetical protein
MYKPDFKTECKECGATPTVVVVGHTCPATELCGFHFFLDRQMVDWNEWNNEPEDTE